MSRLDELEITITNEDRAVRALRRTAVALETLAREPVGYEYRMVNNPTDEKLNAHGREGFQLKFMTVVHSFEGSSEYAYMERPIYAEEASK